MFPFTLRQLAIAALVFSLQLLFAIDSIAEAPARKQVAIFVYEGVQILDYTGPYEAFGAAGCEVFTVAEKEGPLSTAMGMTMTPKYTFETAPRADVLVLPGGKAEDHASKPAVIEWVKREAARSDHVLSVCNGAFFLARAGLLDGLRATTYCSLIDELARVAPKCTVVRDQRWVDNGKIVTAAGISAGIDGALHVVEKLFSRGKAQEAALGMEYDWRPDVGWARANLAELHIRRMLGRTGFDLPDVERWTCLSTQGDAEAWEKRWECVSKYTLADLAKIVETKLAEAHWTKEAARPEGGAIRSTWRFDDAAGKPWSASVEIVPVAEKTGTAQITLKVARTSARG
jgi:putative intracellular protease/amidase